MKTVLIHILLFSGLIVLGRKNDLKLIQITHDGRERQAWAYIPDKLPKGKHPLLFVLHGGGGRAKGMVRLTYGRFNELADDHEFIVIYPQGVKKGWNCSHQKGINYAHEKDIDDVGFVSKLIDLAISDYNADTNRVFATGISNGGFMSFRLGCELGDRIKAIAPVTAQMPVGAENTCQYNCSLLLINGTADPLVPYAGGYVKVFRKTRGLVHSTDSSVMFWSQSNKCEELPLNERMEDKNSLDETQSFRYTYESCEDGKAITLIKVENGGHTWPGGLQYLGKRLIGRTSRDFNACELIWEFFDKQ